MSNQLAQHSDLYLAPSSDEEGAPRRISPEMVTIKPSAGLLDLDLGLVWRYRELLLVIIFRDIQILYRQAALGAAWAIIQPLFAVAIFTIIFGYFAKMPSNGAPYAIFAFAGVLPWTYFAEAVRRSSTGLVSDAELIRKIYFPRLLIPLAGVIAPLLDFAIALVILMGLMLWYGIAPSWNILLALPLIGMAGLLALATGLWLGPVNVRFRDVKYTLAFMIQIWMYASPVVYPASIVAAHLKWIYSLNPMVGIIEGFRWAVLGTGALDVLALSMSLVLIALMLAGGLIFFRHMERSFADMI